MNSNVPSWTLVECVGLRLHNNERSFGDVCVTAGLPPKTDIRFRRWNVRKVPEENQPAGYGWSFLAFGGCFGLLAALG